MGKMGIALPSPAISWGYGRPLQPVKHYTEAVRGGALFLLDRRVGQVTIVTWEIAHPLNGKY